MSVLNANLQCLIGQNLYTLKRQYGVEATACKLLGAETDYKTGKKTIARELYTIRRAVMLPEGIAARGDNTRKSTGSHSALSAGYNLDKAVFIFDARDLPQNFCFKTDDFIIVCGEYYKVAEVEVYGCDLAWVLKTHRVLGADLCTTLDIAADSALIISQATTLET